jgi:hypothetical protein
MFEITEAMVRLRKRGRRKGAQPEVLTGLVGEVKMQQRIEAERGHKDSRMANKKGSGSSDPEP